MKMEAATVGVSAAALLSDPNMSPPNSPRMAPTPMARPSKVNRQPAQLCEDSSFKAGPGTESRLADRARSSQAGVGRLTIRPFHGRSGGYWTTTIPRGR